MIQNKLVQLIIYNNELKISILKETFPISIAYRSKWEILVYNWKPCSVLRKNIYHRGDTHGSRMETRRFN